MITVNGYVRTDKGKVRPINEDNFCVDRYFKAQEAAADTHSFTKRKHVMAGVFDGIGGEENGEVASFIAAKTMAMFDGRVPEGDWNIVLNEMNGRINEYAQRNQPCNMGSTAAMVLVRQGIAEICNLGDSPIYLYSEGRLRKISKDHTELQRALDMQIPDFNFDAIQKNRLTKYLGIRSPELNPHIVVDIELHEGDILLLSSDGLTSMVEDEAIAKIIEGEKGGCQAIADALIKEALDNGGKDNTTVMVICCEEKKSWRERIWG